MIERPAFRPHLDVRVIPAGGVLVLTERDQHLLDGRLFSPLVPMLDGTRTVRELVAALSGIAAAEEVLFAIMRLERAGFLMEGPLSPASTSAVYWLNHGVDPDIATVRLAGAAITLDFIGDVPERACRAALARHGLRVGDEGSIRVVIADHYLHPALASVNEAARRSGQPWLLARVTGSEPWVGPAFIPGASACWECLASRLRGNLPLDDLVRATTGSGRPPSITGCLASTIELAAGMVSTIVQAWIATGRAPAVVDTVVSFDAATLAAERHALDRRPQCPACGDPTMYARQLEDGLRIDERPIPLAERDGFRTVAAATTVRRLERLVSPITGVIRDVRRAASTEGTPLAVFVASHSGPALAHPFAKLYRLPGVGSAGGKGRTEIEARASVLGEAIERASGLYQGDEPFVRASFASLGDAAIHPNACMLYSDRQYASRSSDLLPEAGHHAVPPPLEDSDILEWSPVWSLTQERRRYLPTMYLYFAHPTPPDRMFCPADSNGNACGNTIEEAILQGGLELVERDAVGIWWYNRVRRPAVDMASLEDPFASVLADYYAGVGRTIWLLDLTTDLGIPVFAAISARPAGRDEILLGFGAHLDARIAASRALTELNQMHALVEAAATDADGLNPDMARWLEQATVATQPHVVPMEGESVRLTGTGPVHRDLCDALADLRERLETRGLEMLVLDQTRPDLRTPVAKVIVPGLRQFWARFAPGRLYQVPTRMNWLQRPTREDELNPLPLFV